MVYASNVWKGIFTVSALVLLPFLILPTINYESLELVSSLVYAFILYGSMYVVCKKWGPNLSDLRWSYPEEAIENYIDILLGTLLGAFASAVGIVVLKIVFGISGKIYFSSSAAFWSENGFWSLPFLLVIGPVVEELFFRGLVYEGLVNSFGTTAGFIGNSVLFGVMHVRIDYAIVGVLVGLIITYFYRRTENIWTAISINALLNVVGLFLQKI